ncbi:GAF and ANTAR domain-containing protein [Lentzea alba]|uniref:GAF and ANTAR domain-containing protein n=1 Tax=Lentzea alba TaxID=2714351 RepID=UPI0039BF01B0
MDHDRVARAWAAIRGTARGAPVSFRHACAACVKALDAQGAGLSLARGRGLGEPVCAVGLGTDELEELQFTLGEGPSVDAAAGTAPVLASDLYNAEFGRRWPMFTPAALHRGVRSVISVPLRAGAIKVGVLNLYRGLPGAPTEDEMADLLVYADAAMLLVMGSSDGIAAGRPEVTGNGFDERRAEVHQAAGMISVQLGIGVEEALVRLRAHAYARERRLAEVARDVVERRLRFSRGTSCNPGSGKEEGL